MKLRNLFESSSAFDVNDISSIDFSKLKLSDVEVQTPYDWFIANFLTFNSSFKYAIFYREWEKENKFPLAFLHTMYHTRFLNKPDDMCKAFGTIYSVEQVLDDLLRKLSKVKVSNGKLKVDDLFINNWNPEIDRVPNIAEAESLSLLNYNGNEVPDWLPKKIGRLTIKGKLNSLHNIHKYVEECGVMWLNDVISSSGDNMITHLLGLLKIRGLQPLHNGVDDDDNKAITIINKYLPEGDLLDCQSELIDAGFTEQAKL